MNHVQNQSATETTPPAPTPIALEDQARHFATLHASESGDGMLKTIRRIKRRAIWLTLLALGASMPHQISYLISLCIPYTRWESYHWIDSVGMLLVAGAFPVASDLLIVSCIETISTVVASDASRWRAVAVIMIPLGFSGYVNFAAPGPLLVKVLAAGLVSYIAFSEILKFVKPDFKKLEQAITDPVKQVEKAPDPATRSRRRKPGKQKVLHLLGENPSMPVGEIAKRAGVTENYVYGIRREASKAAN